MNLKDMKKQFDAIPQERIESIIDKIILKNEIKDNQLKRFHKIYSDENLFSVFIKKLITKYSSDKYLNKWHKRNIEPPEDLFWLIYNYARKYGRECNDAEWDNYANQFTTDMYYINNYFISRMDGQGSAIEICKKND